MSDTEIKSLKEPRDPRRVVYLVFYYVGLSILFPYSMLITITDFWYYKFRGTNIPSNSSTEELTELQKNFPAYLSVSGNVPLTLMVLLSAIFGHRFNIKFRLIYSSVLMTLAFAITTVLAGINTDEWQAGLFTTILVVNSLYSAISGIFQASFMGNIGRFPARYIGSANDGLGFGSTLAALINIIIVATGPSLEIQGVACMSVALLIMVLLILLYICVSRTNFYIHHSGLEEKQSRPKGWKDYLFVLKSTWAYVLAVFLNYGLKTTLFPAVAALVKPVSQEPSLWNDTLFLPVCCFFLQAVTDWMGRSVATFTQWPGQGLKTEIGVLIGTVLRAVFIPLLMRCNVAPNNRNTEILFKSDIAYVAILGVFSLTGGYIVNVSLMLGPKKVGLEMQEVAGTIQILVLVLGLGIGSLIGTPLVSLL